jgi:hypothetical protein
MWEKRVMRAGSHRVALVHVVPVEHNLASVPVALLSQTHERRHECALDDTGLSLPGQGDGGRD